MGINVERRGVEDVVGGFQLYEVPCFSVWQGQQTLKFAYSGSDIGQALDLLQQNLEALQQSGTAATYTLKAHAAPDQDGFISNKTKYIGSFNFCMREENTPARQHYQEVGGRASAVPYAVQKQLDEISARLEQLQVQQPAADADIEDDVIVRRMGAVSDLLGSIPGFGDIVAGLANKFLGVNIPVSGMAGVPNGEGFTDGDDQEQMDNVIDQLKRYDPKLLYHLQLLLKVAENNRTQFNMLLSMLEQMK